jgi:hypothetical protein
MYQIILMFKKIKKLKGFKKRGPNLDLEKNVNSNIIITNLRIKTIHWA